MSMPILWDHNPRRVVGAMDPDGQVRFAEPVTDDMLPFGLDFVVLDSEIRDGVRYIKSARLRAISLGHYPQPSVLT